MTTDSPVWTPFDSFREMKMAAEGKILVVRPSDLATVVPLFCSLCQYPMKTADDSIAYRKSLSCHKCDLFCQGNKETISQERWEEYLELRHNTSRPTIVFR